MLYESLYQNLKFGHDAVVNILSGADESLRTIRPAEDKWSIHDNIAHLARYQQVFIQRINTILENELPVFERYKAEEDPEFESWRALVHFELLSKLESGRQSITDLITGLSTKQLNRTGIHKKYGKLNVVQWTEFFLLHEAHHHFTIFQIRHSIKKN